MKIRKCERCQYFQKKDWSWGDLEQRIFGVLGHCMDTQNTGFNEWALRYGRGVTKTQSIFSPKWCRLRSK